MDITGEIVAGGGTSWALKLPPIPGTVKLYAGGVRQNEGAGQDYLILGSAITTVNSYPAGTLTADYTVAVGPVSIFGTDTLSPYALTTLQRVKDIIFDPNKAVTLTGASLTANSTDVTGIVLQTGKSVQVGQVIVGTGIPAGTYIAAVISDTEITLSQAATATNTGQTIYVLDQPTAYDGLLVRYINAVTNYIQNETGRRTFVQKTFVNDTFSISTPRQSVLQLRDYPVFSMASFQWRAGTPTNPNWTDFIPDQFELIDPQTDPVSGITYYQSGQVRVYGVLPRIYNNMIRATYVAGYPVNWANAEDHDTHWLPGDLTALCENLVVRKFTRRRIAGQASQAFEGTTTSWRNELDAEDLDTIGQYRDLKF